ncbi:MAG: beta-ketoacyl-[acyl-carrier-protein] synthase II [Lentisphaerae bacterium]|nr:beta-ketoacyl-[acyl-carrier-protein] synthase II [Lentisphaerota bacterium]
MNERRVVVTGCGVLSCVGNDVQTFWDALVNGRCGIGTITRFDTSAYRTHIAGEIKDLDVSPCISVKEARRMDLFTQYAIMATHQALLNAGLSADPGAKRDNGDRCGCMVSSGVGGLATMGKEHQVLLDRGPDRVSPFLIPMMISDMAAGAVAMQFDLRGPNMGLVTACATGCHSIGEAFWTIKHDDADIMVAGGAEASIVPLGLAGFCALKALSTRNDDPLHASRPFDRDRDGFVMSEGAGVLVLEELGHAIRRGAPILAEVVGYGATADAYHITSPAPDGNGDARAIQMALRHAGITPDELDYLNAHGTSTSLNDKYETMALKSVFGQAENLAISSTKGTTGHALGAAGGLECIACIQSIRTGIVPPTINYENPDPDCDLNYTPNTAVKREINYAMNCNLGFGGHNGAMLFKKYEN